MNTKGKILIAALAIVIIGVTAYLVLRESMGWPGLPFEDDDGDDPGDIPEPPWDGEKTAELVAQEYA